MKVKEGLTLCYSIGERAIRFHIGTSGWHYDWWRGRFYPNDLAKPKWLEFYARHFATVELNNSFYRLPSENAFASWRDSSAEDFAFALKRSRVITHIERLRNAEEPLNSFLFLKASVLCLLLRSS